MRLLGGQSRLSEREEGGTLVYVRWQSELIVSAVAEFVLVNGQLIDYSNLRRDRGGSGAS